MTARIDVPTLAPHILKPMMEMERLLSEGSIEAGLIHLVKLRASQINGCAFCIEMHTEHAVQQGERATRLTLLSAWKESTAFTLRERAALRWTETLTLVSAVGVPEAAFLDVRGALSELEVADLTLVIMTINAWNRLAIGFAYPTMIQAVD